MEIQEILSRLHQAIEELIENEKLLLYRNLNELNLTGHLCKYLSPKFSEYDVDPEYNGDIFKVKDSKSLDIAKNRMREIGKKTNDNNNYRLSPDIIIHTRNTNKNNLVLIEVKKDTNSKKNKEYDLIKLEHLTIDYLGNHYNYKLGVYLEFGTKENAGQVQIKYFQNGEPKDVEKLI